MAKYRINDFNIGDEVYHLSNTKLIMVIIELTPDLNEISCRWVDKNGKIQRREFIAEELGKANDLDPPISF